MRWALAIAALIAGAAQPVLALECLLRDAVYIQPETGYSLAFVPVDPERHPMQASNAFALVPPGTEAKLLGDVVWGNGESRPLGALRYGCPDPASYEAERACTHWQGVIYSFGAGEVRLLPAEDQPAPEQILLPNLGQVLRYSQVLFDLRLGEIPWDVFRIERCNGQ